jgi:hypothetical protein
MFDIRVPGSRRFYQPLLNYTLIIEQDISARQARTMPSDPPNSETKPSPKRTRLVSMDEREVEYLSLQQAQYLLQNNNPPLLDNSSDMRIEVPRAEDASQSTAMSPNNSQDTVPKPYVQAVCARV